MAQRMQDVAAPARHETAPTPPARASWFEQREPVVVGAIAVALFLVVWQAVTSARLVSALFLPGPGDVLEAYKELLADGTFEFSLGPLHLEGQGKIWNDLAVSGQEFGLGYGLAIVVAVPLGLLIGWYKRLRYALDPFITFFYATPRIVLLPLLIIWFGIGVESKVAVVFLGAFFAMVINTTAGVRNLDAHLIRVARSFGARDLQIFRTIALPGSVPFILTGLRLGIGHALIGVVVGELVAARAGIGQLMAIAGATFQSAKVFAGLIIIAATGMLLTWILQRLEQHFEAWRPQR